MGAHGHKWAPIFNSPKNLTTPHGWPWAPMGAHGQIWVLTGYHLMGTHKLPWATMGNHGSPWMGSPMVVHGRPMGGGGDLVVEIGACGRL